MKQLKSDNSDKINVSTDNIRANFKYEYKIVSEWLLFNSAIFQLYHGENKLIFNEMMMRSTLY